MQTEALFENIAERISLEIRKAEKSIYIAVAWFTNHQLFEQLLAKAQAGVVVQLLISNDAINANATVNHELLNTGKSKVYKIGNGDTELMHNKFCIIDFSTTITGSYNWSYKAASNFENVIITHNDTTLAEQFITEFKAIRKLYFPNDSTEEPIFPIHQIVKRLEILKNYIILEDIEEFKRETAKLKTYDFNADIKEIIVKIDSGEYALATELIQLFIANNQQLTVWTDPEIAALKLEIKNLENQVTAFDNEKTELEKLLADFQHRHTMELGDLILEVLRLRKLKFRNDKDKFEEAENDEKEYKEQVDSEKDKNIFDLNEEQKTDLKKKYRKASTLCHPDKFANESPEIQKLAEEVFQDLSQANEQNDLQRVAEILSNLEKGILIPTNGNKLDDKLKLRDTINRLKNKVKALEAQIVGIKESETFKTVSNIDDWNRYFLEIKEKLNKEYDALKGYQL